MIKSSRAIVVEGRYDKIKLDGVVDGIVITTDGFNIFNDKEKQTLIKRLANETGIIILTDSDEAGFRIRRFVRDLAGDSGAIDAYIPDIEGKERRKSSPGKAGLVGVEGVANSILEGVIEKSLEGTASKGQKTGHDTTRPNEKPVMTADLYEDGLIGVPGAADRKADFLRLAKLPTRISTNSLLKLLNRLYGHSEYKSLVAQLDSTLGTQPRQTN